MKIDYLAALQKIDAALDLYGQLYKTVQEAETCTSGSFDKVSVQLMSVRDSLYTEVLRDLKKARTEAQKYLRQGG